MSHEIRTPMNGIIGVTEIALACDVSKSQHRHLSLVKNSAESLMSVIDGILDFSKVEAGMLELSPQDFELREVLTEVLTTLGPRAGARNVELELGVAEDVPDELVGDDTRLRQVLLNLAGNAVKFTSDGTVRLGVLARACDEDHSELEFQIRDTGIGIPKDRQKAIFHAFSQADSSTTRHFGGTGLGLSISASLVELLGGRIWLESEEGVGSTFFFTAVFERQAAAAPPAPAAPADPVRDLGPLDLLVAEDNPVNVLVARKLLERHGFRVTTVGNGRAAVDALAEHRFDLVLMDVQMPGMDGFQATAAIRERERGGAPQTPIIALTAHALASDRQRCLDAGMDGFVTKPVAGEPLLAEIRRVHAAASGSRRSRRAG